jgi:hypothetical protein
MSKIKGKDLLKLGFKKKKERTTHELGELNYLYYTYEVNKHCLLISCSNDEKVNGGYYVEYYDISGIKIYELKDLKILLKVLKKSK